MYVRMYVFTGVFTDYAQAHRRVTECYLVCDIM